MEKFKKNRYFSLQKKTLILLFYMNLCIFIVFNVFCKFGIDEKYEQIDHQMIIKG